MLNGYKCNGLDLMDEGENHYNHLNEHLWPFHDWPHQGFKRMHGKTGRRNLQNQKNNDPAQLLVRSSTERHHHHDD